MTMVEELDSLFQTDGDDQADDDGGNVNQKILPRMDSLVGSVHVEHRRCDLRRGRRFCASRPVPFGSSAGVCPTSGWV